MMTTNGRKWVEHVGAAGLPKGFDQIPMGGQGTEAVEAGNQSGRVWWRHESGKVLKCEPLPMTFAGVAALARVGASGNSQLGSTQGDAKIVAASYAENAVTQWDQPTVPQTVNANDVFDLVTPGGNIAGINDTVYVQFKDPPNAQIWKADPQGADVAYTPAKTVNEAALVPQAQIGGNGLPTTTPPGGGGTGGTTGGATSTASKVLPWVLGAGAVLLVGAVGYGVYEHQKSGGHAHHAREVGTGRRNKKRDRFGRFR